MPSDTNEPPEHIKIKISQHSGFGKTGLHANLEEIRKERSTVKHYRQPDEVNVEHIEQNKEYFYKLFDPKQDVFQDTHSEINHQVLQRTYPQLVTHTPKNSTILS